MWAVVVCTLAALILWLKARHLGKPLSELAGLALVYAYVRVRHAWSSRGPRPPAHGPGLLIANHSCSADPAFLQAGCSRPLSFLIAQEYYQYPGLRRLFDHIGCVPVQRNGQDVAVLRIALSRLKAGRLVCIFPEGSLSNAGRSRLRRGRCGAAWLALKSRVPVYPAYIAGGPQTSSVLGSWLGTSRVQVHFGPPIDLSAYYNRPMDRKLLEEVTDLLMHQIDALRPKTKRLPRSLEG